MDRISLDIETPGATLLPAAEKDAGWGAGASSPDYPGYAEIIDILRASTFDSMLDAGTA